MSATFFIGMACGLILGSWVTWLAIDWMHPVDVEEAGVSLFPMGGKK